MGDNVLAEVRVEVGAKVEANGGEWDEAHGYFEAAWGRVLDRLVDYFSGPDRLPDA